MQKPPGSNQQIGPDLIKIKCNEKLAITTNLIFTEFSQFCHTVVSCLWWEVQLALGHWLRPEQSRHRGAVECPAGTDDQQNWFSEKKKLTYLE